MNAMGQQNEVLSLPPEEVFQRLKSDSRSVLIDVRTQAEWSYVGLPDLSSFDGSLLLLEWKHFPAMAVNAEFANQLRSQVRMNQNPVLYFICRSGQRSMDAARSVQAACAERGENPTCINVSQGFEGDLDEVGHRGKKNGWKHAGLPWRQS